MWATLGDYIEDRRKTQLISRRELARRLGVDASYLTKVVAGDLLPNAKTCNRISDYFGDPRDIVLRLCGWLEPNQDQDAESGARELALLLKDDPDLRALIRLYQSQSPAGRRGILKTVEENSSRFGGH